MTLFLAATFAVAVLAGATAAIAGFGIGSLLTPLLALRYGTGTAVAAVALPHFVATTLRWWRLREHVDVGVIRGFGLLSAGGALAGALLHARFSARALTLTLALLLLATAIATITNWSERWSPRGPLAGLFGLLSGLFGGLAGNQGGLRAAALLSFPLSPIGFVATSTATALLVDLARTPVYLWRAGSDLVALAVPIGVATVGVTLGTLLGERVLFGMSPRQFRIAIAALIGLLGVWTIAQLR